MNETGKGVLLQSKNMTLFWLISNIPPPLTNSGRAKGITSVISALVASVPSEEKRCQFCWFFFLFATMVEEGNSVARESSRKQRSRPVGRGGKDEQRYQFGATEPVSQNDKSFLLPLQYDAARESGKSARFGGGFAYQNGEKKHGSAVFIGSIV